VASIAGPRQPLLPKNIGEGVERLAKVFSRNDTLCLVLGRLRIQTILAASPGSPEVARNFPQSQGLMNLKRPAFRI
jgi:hypothetical protein